MSEDEYERLQRYCASVGARSLSDLARTILCAAAAEPGEDNLSCLPAQFRSLQKRVKKLSLELERLSASVESVTAVHAQKQ